MGLTMIYGRKSLRTTHISRYSQQFGGIKASCIFDGLSRHACLFYPNTPIIYYVKACYLCRWWVPGVCFRSGVLKRADWSYRCAQHWMLQNLSFFSWVKWVKSERWLSSCDHHSYRDLSCVYHYHSGMALAPPPLPALVSWTAALCAGRWPLVKLPTFSAR